MAMKKQGFGYGDEEGRLFVCHSEDRKSVV